MKRVDGVKNAIDAINAARRATGSSRSTEPTALQKFLPNHPKVKGSGGGETAENESTNAFDNFVAGLLNSSKGCNEKAIHELFVALKTIEDVLRVIEPNRVYYRVLMAVFIFKDYHGFITSNQRERATVGLFSSVDKCDEKVLEVVAKAVQTLRRVASVKGLQEAITIAWNKVAKTPNVLPDRIFTCSQEPASTSTCLPLNVEAFLNAASGVVGKVPARLPPIFKDSQESEFDPSSVYIRWTDPSKEKDGSSTEAYQGTVSSSDFDAYADQPQTSTSSGELTCSEVISTLQAFFPDSYDSLSKGLFDMLAGSKSNNELQGDLIDLLGFDQFEMVGRLLEVRYKLVDEMSNTKRKVNDAAKKMAAIPPGPAQPSGPAYCQQVLVQSKAQAEMRKEMRKEQKRANRELNRIQHAFGEDQKLELELAQREAIKQRQLELDQLRWQPTLRSVNNVEEVYPFVFDARIKGNETMLAINGMKFALPEGSARENYKTNEQVTVPPVDRGSVQDIQHVYIRDMDEVGQLGFKGFEKLNAVQSLVFEQAYKTRENLLICAPTGAGKTNIAMLTILNTIHEHRRADGSIAKDDFKIIYIAPMKALATEMTEGFGKRLAPLGLKVRELTGDTQLSKKEIAETQMLVLTPEKWDVMTRKGASDNSLISLVRLLIIDEVHLLHDDRGPVIESIVARTLRQVEISQSGIRIVGLSATLPNYVDVARFLRVNPYKGLFYFDGRFRPVPLTQKFIGVKRVGGIMDNQRAMDDVCYDEVVHFVKRGHQVLVFVHARNATAKLAMAFRERAAALHHLDTFQDVDKCKRSYAMMEKSLQSSRNKQLFELFRFGFGVHHAGLVRSDRLLMEKAFGEGHITVLFCTATLAWGVNLPAHAVVIRGTEVFDSEKGVFADLGVLDVQQIFGRAGRPQFENEGHGIIITTQNKMDKYLAMLVHQTPIESNFFKRIHDNLNAEIVLGTVSTIEEAVEWMTYTYFYTRATRNPMAYGIAYAQLEKDRELRNYLSEKMMEVATKLDRNQMIRFDRTSEQLSATDLGRIASGFYIKMETIERLHETGVPVTLNEMMPDDMVIAMISAATEFGQLKIREEECPDLEEIRDFACFLPIRSGGLASVEGKVNVLIQSYISRHFIRSFSLASESLYVQQNAGRICRALFEIVIRRGWVASTRSFLTMAKSLEKRMWPTQSSLRQLDEGVTVSLIDKIERRKLTEHQLLELEPKELGHMFSCDGEKLYKTLRYIPRLYVEATLKPITYTIVQVYAVVTPAFIWNDRILGKTGAQSFYILLENTDDNTIIHYEKILIPKKKVLLEEPQTLIFTIPIRDHQLKSVFQLRVTNEYFLSDDTVVPLSLHNVIMPRSCKAHTDLLPLDPLPVSTLKNELFESIYSYKYFNPIQTQVFHTLYKRDENALIGAPTGSGKTLCAELAIFRLLQDHPGKKCAYIAPLKALVRERVSDWAEKFEKRMGYKVVEISGDKTPSVDVLNDAAILITTPEKWDGITRSWATREYVQQVGLVVIDEIHLLGVDRGAVLEAIITRLKVITRRSAYREQPARIIGLSTALANAGDVAEWLGVKDAGLFNFRPSVRPVPIQVHIQGFPGQHYCPRMALMNKPAFKAIQQYSPLKPVLIFVASRRQTRLTALSFVNQLVTDADPRQWLHMEMEELEMVLHSIKDENLKLTLPFGIGMHHAGLSPNERAVVEQLYLDKKIQILIATATLAWGINMPAHLVIVKGTEYFDGKTNKYIDFPVTDVLQMMGRAGRPQFDDSAVAVIYVQDTKKIFYKKFLYEPFPVESSLLPVLANHVNAEINAGTITSKQSVMEYIAGTYLYRRLFANPNYYGLEEATEEELLKFLVSVVDKAVLDLIESSCVIVDEETQTLASSPYGRLASVYYLEHMTIRFLLNELNSQNTVEELLKILTHVPEYAEIPVRHNEDGVNAELQRRLRIRFPTNVLDSPHTKAHLLFQAHFSRVEIPTDYRTDQKSVLDQCVRILQAMREMCVLNGWLSTAMNITLLQQMCHSARWYDDHPLLILPHLRDHEADRIGGDVTVPMLQDRFGVERANSTEAVKTKGIQKIIEKTTLDRTQAEEVVAALCRLPVLSFDDAYIVDVGGRKLPIPSSVWTEGPRRDADYLKLKANTTYRMSVHVKSFGPCKNNKNAFLPRWGKEKTAGWLAFCGDTAAPSGGSVSFVGLIGAVDGQSTARFELKAPAITGRRCLTFYAMSDCYLGLDQEYSIPVELV